MSDAATAGEQSLHGSNRVSSRAIRAVVSAITATELDTAARTVGVELDDDNGALAVSVSAPIGIAALTAVPSDRSSRARPGATVLERASAAQATIRSRTRELTGSSIATVNLRLTGARIEGDDRVV